MTPALPPGIALWPRKVGPLSFEAVRRCFRARLVYPIKAVARILRNRSVRCRRTSVHFKRQLSERKRQTAKSELSNGVMIRSRNEVLFQRNARNNTRPDSTGTVHGTDIRN
jgi:hypothetical protein